MSTIWAFGARAPTWQERKGYNQTYEITLVKIPVCRPGMLPFGFCRLRRSTDYGSLKTI